MWGWVSKPQERFVYAFNGFSESKGTWDGDGGHNVACSVEAGIVIVCMFGVVFFAISMGHNQHLSEKFVKLVMHVLLKGLRDA